MKDNQKVWLNHLTLLGLCIVAFAMPTSESVKWAGVFLFGMGTLVCRIMDRRFGWRKPDGFEWVLLVIWSVALVSTLVNWPLPNGVSGLKRGSMVLAIGWLVYTNAYSEKQLKGVLSAVMGGVMLGLVLSAHQLFTGQNPYLEFASMPNLNRSAIYHVLSLFVMLGMLMDSRRIFSKRSRILIACCFVIGVGSLFVMGSRGALLGFISGMVLLAVFVVHGRKAWLTLTACIVGSILALAIISAVWDNPILKGKLAKFTHYYHDLKDGGNLSDVITPSEKVRYDYIRIAWAQITQKEKMFLGSGPSTFKYIDVESLTLDKPLLMYQKNPGWDKPSHAHNEYLTRWVNGGLVGLGTHLLFLFYIGIRLWVSRKQKGGVHWQWVACVGFLATAGVSGMFNTVLTNEMGWLSMIIVGATMNWYKRQTGDA
jgi:O-antigen ligase